MEMINMLIKLKIFIVITIIILIILSPISYSSFTPDVVELYDGKVMAYSEISAFKLVLANGATISSSSVEGDSEQVVTEINGNVQLVLVIDVSGSMDGTKMDKAKSAAKTMVENLMELGGNTEIALVSFSSSAKIEVNLTNSEQDVLNSIDNLTPNGGTYMYNALDLTGAILTGSDSGEDENNESDIHKYCIILTDGVTETPEACYEKLSEMQSNQIGIYGILLESNYKDAFQQNGNTVGVLYENISSQQLLDIYNEIFETIHDELVENVIPEFEFSGVPQNYMVLDNGIFITIDTELLQGAQLCIEYVINIKSSMEINEVEVEDLTIGNIAYNSDSEMLTEGSINSDYGWSFLEDSESNNDNGNVLWIHESNADNPVIEKRGVWQKKIVYSKILSTAEDSNFEHSIVFRLNGDSENGTGMLESLPVIITPPYGNGYSNIFIILGIIILIIIAYIIIKRIKFIRNLKRK